MDAATSSGLSPGFVVAGKFRVCSLLGEGGMAAVYEAVHVEIGKRVAIKVLDAHMSRSSSVVERFIREARAAAAIESPYICGVHDVGRLDDGRPFLVLDLLMGESLYQRIVNRRTLEPQDVVRIFSQVAKGLAKAHAAGIIHRDLKPENIFLALDDDGFEIAKVLDFGLAKFYIASASNPADSRLTREGTILGTPCYMSPELVNSELHVDSRTDLWALGCLVFECLTGKTVWDGSRGIANVLLQIMSAPLPVPSEIRPDLPLSFDAWLNRALDRAADKRFQSAIEFANELSVALGCPITNADGSLAGPMRASISSGRSWSARGSEPISIDVRASRVSMLGVADGPLTMQEPGVVHPGSIRSSVELDASRPVRDSDASKISTLTPPRGKARWLALAFVVAGATAVSFWFGSQHGKYSRPSQALASMSSGAGLPEAGQLRSQIVAASVPPSASAHVPGPKASAGWAGAAVELGDIRRGADLLAAGQDVGAVEAYERALLGNAPGVTRPFVEMLRVATTSKVGSCRLAGLARPRATERKGTVRHATVVSSSLGDALGWVEQVGRQKLAHAYLVPLGQDLWAAASPLDVSPEATNVVDLQAIAHGASIVALYGDAARASAGVTLRGVDLAGRNLNPGMAVTRSPATFMGASLTRTGDGRVWLAYLGKEEGHHEDIFLRRLSPALVAEPPVRLTHAVSSRASSMTRFSTPAVAASDDGVSVVYRRGNAREYEVVQGEIRHSELDRGQDLSVDFASRYLVMTPSRLKVHDPSCACDAVACHVAWSDEPSGCSVARVIKSTGMTAWKRTFSAKGTQVSVASSPTGESLLAWVEDNRLRVGQLGGDGISASTVVGTVFGQHPRPAVVAEEPGRWLVAWLTYESGHPDIYVARVICERN